MLPKKMFVSEQDGDFLAVDDFSVFENGTEVGLYKLVETKTVYLKPTLVKEK